MSRLPTAHQAVLVALGIAAGLSCSRSGGTTQSTYHPTGGNPGAGFWTDLGTSAPAHDPPEAVNSGTPSRGGTLTFLHIGAPGWWGRRLDVQSAAPACNLQSELLSGGWGSEYCCRTKHEVASDQLTPFNEQQTLVLDGPLRVSQLAVYQPLAEASGPWAIRSLWDRRAPAQTFNLHFSGPKGASTFTGDLGNNCSFYEMQEKDFPCGPGSDPYCPGSALDHHGWAGSKLLIVLASMPYADDPSVKSLSCIQPGQDERQQDSPWIGLSASELVRDGWSGYNPCHCYSNTSSMVGDGCGQINVFEIIAEASGAQWGNRDIISTGIRSYQVGSLGGATCGIQGCAIAQFPADADLLDANHLVAMSHGAVIDADNRQSAEGPVWRRALDERYYMILLDESARTVQVLVLHPANLPAGARALLPNLPNEVSRSAIDAVLALRLPQ
jgi:hypothetical protein